jgi:DNA-binding protein H-NS
MAGRALEVSPSASLAFVRMALLQEFRERAAAIGMRVSLEPLTAPAQTRKTRADAGAPLPVKYQGPNGEAWSGRGIAPRWLKAFELEGRSREEFRVKEGSE